MRCANISAAVRRPAPPPRSSSGSHSLGALRFRELAGPVAEGCPVSALWNPDTAEPASDSFIERFRAARGHAPDYTAVYTYDATRLLVAAIRRAGPGASCVSVSPLFGLSPWAGLGGGVFPTAPAKTRAQRPRLGTIHNGAVTPMLQSSFSTSPFPVAGRFPFRPPPSVVAGRRSRSALRSPPTVSASCHLIPVTCHFSAASTLSP
ncbi:MAG: ABC transporter substrate-binding protein [Opitutaceae bacterium]|nr:ABC transporter substrate-binding protein [Opitutaceae bacterium]